MSSGTEAAKSVPQSRAKTKRVTRGSRELVHEHDRTFLVNKRLKARRTIQNAIAIWKYGSPARNPALYVRDRGSNPGR